MTLFRPLKRLCLSVAGCLLAVGLFTQPAAAQFGEAAGIGEAMQQDFLSRDIRLFADGLNLDDTQRVIVEALFIDYEQAFDAGINQMKAKLEGMREQMSPDDPTRVLKMVFKPFTDWSVEKGKLYEQFLQNVQVVLTPEQMAKWPAFERSLYREKYIGRGQLSGESLNLFYVLRDMHLDDKTTQSIQPVVDQYDVALDQALRARQTAITDPENPMLLAMAENDSQKRLESLSRILDLRLKVRDVNDQYIDLIAAALPADLGATFKADALDRAYPRIYRETQVQRMFRMAKEIEGLDSGVLQAVIELEGRYLGELDGINRQLHDAMRKGEPQEFRQRAEDFDKRMDGQQPERREDATRDLFAQRDEMSRRYAKELQALLTPDQFAQLPGAYRWVEAPQEAGAAAVSPELQVEPDSEKGVHKGAKSSPSEKTRSQTDATDGASPGGGR